MTETRWRLKMEALMTQLEGERDSAHSALRAIASPSGKTVEQCERIARHALEPADDDPRLEPDGSTSWSN